MKVLILSLLCALSVNVYALDYAPIVKMMNAKLAMHHVFKKPVSSKDDPQPPQEPTPIRRAAVKASILKLTMTKNSKGGYDTTIADVCTVSGSLNVYDFRTNTGISIREGDVDVASCESTFGGQPISVHIGGIVFLNSMSMLTGKVQDVKYFNPNLWYVPDDSRSGFGNGADGFVGTADMANKSMLIPVNPGNDITCSLDQSGNQVCTPNESEMFQAFFDIEDAP